eukprot:scaffold12209_cov27-Phaeocystis_antarctica.AAC.1
MCGGQQALLAGQPLPARPVGRGGPTLGAAPGAGQACSGPFWPSRGGRRFPPGHLTAAQPNPNPNPNT